MNLQRLAGQVAFVTGGGKGMGSGIARLFAKEGARVAIVDRDEAAARQTAQEILAEGHEALPITADIAKESDVQRAIDKTVERFGGLQILINNAGIVQLTPIHECTEKAWDEVMAINLKSIF